MSLDFQQSSAKGNEFVNSVAKELNVPRDMAGRIIRAVLHALRNRISHEESFQLMAQLPLALKAAYVDGWKYSKDFERIHHVSEFLDEVRKEDAGLAGYDFGNDERAEKAVTVVFFVLHDHVSAGEFTDVLASLPLEISKFIRNGISKKEMM